MAIMFAHAWMLHRPSSKVTSDDNENEGFMHFKGADLDKHGSASLYAAGFLQFARLCRQCIVEKARHRNMS